MIKELDLLKQIKRVDSNMSREQNQRYSELEQAIAEHEELKRYPTADEVCKALSEQLKTQIKIGKNKHGITFNYAETGKKIISLNYDLIHINVQLPYNLITLIGRFYEAQQ